MEKQKYVVKWSEKNIRELGTLLKMRVGTLSLIHTQSNTSLSPRALSLSLSISEVGGPKFYFLFFYLLFPSFFFLFHFSLYYSSLECISFSLYIYRTKPSRLLKKVLYPTRPLQKP